MADKDKVKERLIKKMTQFYNMEGSGRVSDKDVSAIKDSVTAGVLNFFGLTQHNEESMKMLGDIKEKALAASREGNPSALARGISKLRGMFKEEVQGKQYGGDIKRYGQPRKVNAKYDG